LDLLPHFRTDDVIRWAATSSDRADPQGVFIRIALCVWMSLSADCGRSQAQVDGEKHPPAVLPQSPFASPTRIENTTGQSEYRELTHDPRVVSTGHASVERFETRNDSELSRSARASQQRQSSVRIVPERRDAKLPTLVDNRRGGPYCGINSLFVCLSALGIETEPGDFVSKKYVGSYRGSSVNELLDAARDFGVQAEAFSHLTDRDLRRIQTPLILHMRSSSFGSDYDHWVAFLGWDGDRMRVVDAPHSVEATLPADLLANWSGAAIAVSMESIDRSFVSAARVDYVLFVTLLGLVLYSLHAVFQPAFRLSPPGLIHASLRSRALQVGVVCGFSCLLALAYHSLSSIGFLNNPTAVAEVTRRYYTVGVTEIGVEEMENEILQGESLVVDARRADDYDRGCLPGAISLSVDSTLQQRKQVLAGVPKGTRIVVYCQSSGCKYSDEVAGFLEFNGYSSLTIFRGGFVEWNRSQSIASLGNLKKP
jgi:rhodanese-related sulfurtransferase